MYEQSIECPKHGLTPSRFYMGDLICEKCWQDILSECQKRLAVHTVDGTTPPWSTEPLQVSMSALVAPQPPEGPSQE